MKFEKFKINSLSAGLYSVKGGHASSSSEKKKPRYTENLLGSGACDEHVCTDDGADEALVMTSCSGKPSDCP